ncbi:hypothetical protein [Microbacterium indicum]|uniref:hypothetical protein n=1 Tax=Microbacterium indicum TaxID=358100 RepID=UPI000A0598D8|nr:hypothetical protein [Microbacterium indicum]
MSNEQIQAADGGARVTTTHAAWGSGDPHLLVRKGEERFTHHLDVEVTRIGSAAGVELRVPETDGLHATIVHDERDEFVLTMHGSGETNANLGASGAHPGNRSETLRTGARFTAGPWEFVYSRAESSDHGRPYGGREGGELTVQPAQPERPDYTSDPSAEEARPLEPENDWHATEG